MSPDPTPPVQFGRLRPRNRKQTGFYWIKSRRGPHIIAEWDGFDRWHRQGRDEPDSPEDMAFVGYKTTASRYPIPQPAALDAVHDLAKAWARSAKTRRFAELLRAALATPEPPEQAEILTPTAPPPIPTFHLEVCIGGSMHGMKKELAPRYSVFSVPVTTGIKARFDPPDLRDFGTIGFAYETYRRVALHTSGPGERMVITWWHLEGLPVDDGVLAQVARAFDARSKGDA